MYIQPKSWIGKLLHAIQFEKLPSLVVLPKKMKILTLYYSSDILLPE